MFRICFPESSFKSDRLLTWPLAASKRESDWNGVTRRRSEAQHPVNKDVRLSIASVAIPYGQRFITINLETLQNLVFVAPGNLYLRVTTQKMLSADATTKGTKAAVAVQDTSSSVTNTPWLATGSIVDTTTGGINNITLYINNIFVNQQ